MQWEIVLLLIIASPFALYHLIRYGICRLKKTPAENRIKNEIAVGQ